MDDLNARIARALGYTVRTTEHENMRWWDHATRTWYDEYMVDLIGREFRIPDYAHDLNAAIRLITSYCVIESGVDDGQQIWRVNLGLGAGVAENASLPAAICEAWLQYDAARKEGVE